MFLVLKNKQFFFFRGSYVGGVPALAVGIGASADGFPPLSLPLPPNPGGSSGWGGSP